MCTVVFGGNIMANNITPYKNKDGKIVSYRIKVFCKGK